MSTMMTAARTAAPVIPSNGCLRPLGLGEVRITGGFWAARQRRNAAATLPHIESWIEKAGWIGNFDAATQGRLPAARRGREFSDSEVYKLLEAMAWELGRAPTPELERRFATLVTRVAAAQEADGYLNTRFGRPGQGARYSDLEWGHELYCYGHLIQAAVARARTSGIDQLVEIACRAADHVCSTFGAGGIESVCGHPVIETALVELFRVTGERRYLEQAALFVDRRGHHVLTDVEFGRSYFQDDVPFREATVMRGHAVRALYLGAGAIDVAVETDDSELLQAAVRQWENTVARRTYLTGGMGSRHQDEAFGEDFMLPPDRSYSETCAGVGSVMMSWRLLLANGDPHFADLIERTLFNVIATSPSVAGTEFFYTNTLHQRVPGTPSEPGEMSLRAASSLRAPWFEVSCCPPNVARTLASLAGYLATADESGVQLHQYANAIIDTRLSDDRPVHLEMVTDYPQSGVITIRSLQDSVAPFTLSLRIPSWGAGSVLVVDGTARAVDPGTVRVERRFAAGDEIRLELPVAPRFTEPDPRIDAVRGTVAIERGPVVLCAESTDLPPAASLDAVRVRIDRPPLDLATVKDPVAAGPVAGVYVVSDEPTDRIWPYASPEVRTETADELTLPLIPYHSWANRGPSVMRVWLPTA